MSTLEIMYEIIRRPDKMNIFSHLLSNFYEQGDYYIYLDRCDLKNYIDFTNFLHTKPQWHNELLFWLRTSDIKISYFDE